MRPIVAGLFTALAAALCLPAVAQSTPPKAVVQQVDGITSAVVDNLWAYTDKYFHDGDYNRIIGLCRICVEADPNFNEAYSDAAYLLWSQRETKAADYLLDYGIKRTNNKADLNFEMGDQLIRSKDYVGAEKYLKRAIEKPVPSPLPYTRLAYAYRRQGKIADEVRMWEESVRRFPNWPVAKKNLEGARERLKNGTGKVDGAKV